MPDIPSEQVREALFIVVSDPDLGPATLSNGPAMSNLLKDLLPDAPREKNLLVAAAEAGIAATILDHASQGIDAGSAIRLAAASLAASTHFTDAACTWVATELAAALGVTSGPAAETTRLPAGDITVSRKRDDGAGPGGVQTASAAAFPPDTARAGAAGAASVTARPPSPLPAVAWRPVARTRALAVVSALLVAAGAICLLVGLRTPVESGNPLWSTQFTVYQFCLPTTALIIAALSALTLIVPRTGARLRGAAGTAATVCGVQMLVFFYALYYQFRSTSDSVAGFLAGLLLLVGGIGAMLAIPGSARTPAGPSAPGQHEDAGR
jgi:hypothetical protein